MKHTVTFATIAFWIAVAGLNLMATREPSAADGASRFTLAEIARHADAKSCWMAIDGVVYDFTDYLPQHPAPADAMPRHCGTEATEAFRTKDAGRPHSPYAAQLLPKYRIGELAR
ncbi:MAG: cytochrome b5 domain-containing protein [Burkholderiaceae bacterium]|nr:cytochrome b5 domain-containing protein [Burkholderiaceae bacterium]